MKILFITAKSDSPSARWRILQFLPHFRNEGVECAAEELPVGMLAKLALAKKAAGFDVVVLQKRLLPKLVYTRLRKHAKRLVFEFDDNVTLKRSEDGQVREPATRDRRFRRTLKGADAVITTNEVLADLARRHTRHPSLVHVLPSVIDVSRYPPRPPARSGDAPVIGWMGSGSNLQYLEVVRQPLARLCRRIGDLTVRIVCEKALPLDGVRVDHKPFEAARESDDLHSFDIAIAPLVEDPWTRGKISTKILSYFAVGLPVVASDVASNRLYAKDGVNALLAGTLTEWEERLAELVGDPARRHALGGEARATVEREFSIGAMVPKYLELFRALVSSTVPPGTGAASAP